MIIVECALNERKNDCYYLQAGNRRRRRRLGLWCLQLGSHTPGGLQSGWSGKRELGLTNSPDNRALFSCFSDSRTRFYTLQNPRPPPPAPTPLRSATEREPIMPMVWGSVVVVSQSCTVSGSDGNRLSQAGRRQTTTTWSRIAKRYIRQQPEAHQQQKITDHWLNSLNKKNCK